ncbi:MAG: hypothetical protein GXO07_05920 [Crenarchaeota archaeon]|nr:hypothetical protein [Thermoproteota archaeon]
MSVNLNHPLVQAKLLVSEKEEKVKVLPGNAYSDLEGAVKDMAGPSGCKHVIINVGLVNDVWDVFEALVCNGNIIASNKDLRSYSPEAQVERVVAESYIVPEEIVPLLEEYSKIKVESAPEYEVVEPVEPPPLPRARAPSAPAEDILEPKRPTDLLSGLGDEWSELKEITHSMITFLETKEVEDYAVSSGRLEDGRLASVVYLPPEYKPKYEEIKSGIMEIAKERDVRVVLLNVGGKEELVELGG